MRRVHVAARFVGRGIRRARGLVAGVTIAGCAAAVAAPVVLSGASLYAPGINRAAGDLPGFTGDPVAIPEPGGLPLVVAGLALLAVDRVRRG